MRGTRKRCCSLRGVSLKCCCFDCCSFGIETKKSVTPDARLRCWSVQADLHLHLSGNKGYSLVEFGVVQHG